MTRYTEYEDQIIRDNLAKVGYVGLMKLLPEREYQSLRDHVKKLRKKGLMPNPEHIGRPNWSGEPKRVGTSAKRRATESTPLRPKPPGQRHEAYMNGWKAKLIP